ncbi:MAG: DUF4917 family protein [Chloroflexaceae bacterium]|nr:DUF4917 family protein [Chloroflexaceae bacterium]
MPQSLLTYDQVRRKVHTIKTKVLLLGNGFSIGCDPIFKYKSLFTEAKDPKFDLTQAVQQILEKISDHNFEHAMRLLWNAHEISEIYKILPEGKGSPFLEDLERLKQVFLEVIADTHLARPSNIDERKKKAAASILSEYDFIFTTNYDLLLYWLIMYMKGQKNPSSPNKKRFFEDGFYDEDEYQTEQRPPVVPYTGKFFDVENTRMIWFLHGALHLYEEGDNTYKHCWARTGVSLKDHILTSLERKQYPLCVTDGTSKKKQSIINKHSYLYEAWRHFSGKGKALIVYGHKLGHEDEHISDAIAKNLDLEHVYVGVYRKDEENNRRNLRERALKLKTLRDQHIHDNRVSGKNLEVHFYDSETVNMWGDAGS